MTVSDLQHFGPMVTRRSITDEVIRVLREWEGEYLAAIERFEGLDPRSLPTIATWESGSDYRRHIGSPLPAVIVNVQTTAGDPVRDGEGLVSATWNVMLQVLAAGRVQRESELTCDRYIAAFRSLALHMLPRSEHFERAWWGGDTYVAAPTRDRDTLGAGTSLIRVEVPEMLRAVSGPWSGPRPDPYTDVRPVMPTVTDSNITIRLGE